jgi:hypothetical protein
VEGAQTIDSSLAEEEEESHGRVREKRRGGRGTRGWLWRPSFYPEQHPPPPFDPYLFPRYGFDPYMQQAPFRPPRVPYPRNQEAPARGGGAKSELATTKA